MYIVLERAVDIQRDKDSGAPWTWRSTGETIKTFTDGDEFIAYVKEHAAELKDAVAFTGSASLISQANYIIGQELRKAGKL